MKLVGKLIKDTRVIRQATVEKNDEGLSFRAALEQSLIDLCRLLDIQVPIWLRDNTREFAALRKTSFTSEHFMEDIHFSRFEIQVID